MDIGRITGNRMASSYKFRLLTNPGDLKKQRQVIAPKADKPKLRAELHLFFFHFL
jgi:hypothetical protein